MVRAEDLMRHLANLAARRYEGAESWADRVGVFWRGPGPASPGHRLVRRSFNHAHLRGSTVGDWPLQVINTEDAARQLPIVQAIVEAELHQRIYEGAIQ